MSNKDHLNKDHEEALYKISLPADHASELEAAGRASQEKRGKGGPDQIGIPTDKQTEQLEKSGKSSQEATKQHPTGELVDVYKHDEHKGGKKKE